MRASNSLKVVPQEAATASAPDAEERRYRGIFENAIWGIFQTTPDGQYLVANPALARIYGYDAPEQLLGGLTDIGRQLYVDPQRRDAFIGLMQRDGRVTGFESQVYRRDGAVIWISENCREVRSDLGDLLYFEGTVEEITTRKQAEHELTKAKEEAEQASRAKTTFLANMSHELRTPLNAVLGFSEIMRNEMFGPLGDRRYKGYARDIMASGAHLLDVINSILDLSKIEAGHFELDEQTVDVGNVLAICARLVAERAMQRGIIFDATAPVTPIALRADPIRLKQILLNLLSNAVKFTPAGQSVRLTAERAPDGAVIVQVSDTGIGMTAEEMVKAFEPFQQVDASLSRRYEGTGLGLTLAKALIEMHGGTLTLQSAPGLGTTATLTLPAWRLAETLDGDDGVEAVDVSGVDEGR